MTRILSAAILLGAVFAIIWLARISPERNPLLIDAAWAPKDWCDVTYSPRPLINLPSRQWSRKADRT